MKSHQCHFTYSELAKLVLAPLLPLAIFALLMQAGTRLHWLPRAWPALDMDRAVLTHQAWAAQSPHPAELLLLGDSSCLMGVSASQLSKKMGIEALSLATLSYVDLSAQALMLQKWQASNPGQLKTVVLLMHPDALRRPEASAYHENFLKDLLQGHDPAGLNNLQSRLERNLGLDAFRNRILAPILPMPLPGRYGFYYGFTTDLCRYLTRERGSAVDPNAYDPETSRGSAEYRLARGLEAQSNIFKDQVPPGARLVVGLTPSPVSFVTEQHEEIVRGLLVQWGKWLRADLILTNLPAILPDSYFASSSHLNQAGQEAFTRRLAEVLAPAFNPVQHPP